MAQFSVNVQRFDPYKNFKFRVKWDGQYVAGVSKVHGLQVWALTSDLFTLSAHAVVDDGGDFHAVLNGIEDTLKERFNIEHVTIQLETESREEKEFKAF